MIKEAMTNETITNEATPLSTIDGIGPLYEQRLRAIGIDCCEALLEMGASASGRMEISVASGIRLTLVHRFVIHADLCRVRGVVGEYAELLEASGVDSVPELGRREAGRLWERMMWVNQREKLVRSLPSLEQVAQWVGYARFLPRVVTY